MKQILLLITLTFSQTLSFGQIPANIDSIYNFIKQNSIHSKDANWQTIDEGFKKKLKSAKTDIDSIQPFVYVFTQLKDFHSSINYNGRQFSNYPEFDDSTLNYLMPLVNLSNQRTNIFSGEILENNYIYLQVPGVMAWGNDISVYAQRLSDTLCKYVTSKTKGIVLDLRLNGGGQFSSMAAGLAPLLGDKIIAGGVDSELKRTMSFELRKGNIFLNANPMTTIKHKSKYKLTQLPVAILIGPNTRSSGSILAISFKGRPKTIFIGDNTANGYTTSNDYFTYGNNLILNLSTANSVDRNSKVYKDIVKPDIIIKGEDNFNSIENDIKVKAAVKWLKNNSR